MNNKFCVLCRRRMRLLQDRLHDNRFGAPGKYKIYFCQSCNFAQTSPRLKRHEIGQLYSRYYTLSQKTPQQVKVDSQLPNPLLTWWLGLDHQAHLYVPSKSTVLDIGSGSGASLIYLKRKKCQVYGVEPDPTAQKLAQALKLQVYTGFLKSRPFPQVKFSHLTASQVIEHEPDPSNFLLNAYRQLAKNGQLILSFPNLNSFNRYLFGRHWLNWHVPYHLNFFTLESFIQLADKHKFVIQFHRSVTPLVWIRYQLQIRFNPFNNRRFISSLILITSLVCLPFYRLLDFFGLGDSLVVGIVKSA